MPAAVRGAGRSSAGARSKSSASPTKNRKAPAKTGAAAAPGFAISPRLILALTGLTLGGAVVVGLSTGHRGEQLVASASDAMVGQSAALGFRVDTVRLVGASPQSTPDILHAAGLSKGAPLFGVDLDAARRRIEQVGWVKSARVMRLLPGSVVIAVDERQLLAVWEHDGRAVVIDSGGVIAPEADPARFAGLPLVVGEGANEKAGDVLPLVMARPRLAERLDAVVRVDGRRWDLRLKGDTVVQLPPTGEASALIKLDQLDQTSRILDLGLSRIDLRDPEMVVVRPRQKPAAGVGGAE